MRTISSLLFTCLVSFVLISRHAVAQDGKGCEVQATVETENTLGNPSHGRATVKLKNGQAPDHIIFYDGLTGRQLQKDLTKSSIENLKKGSYYCIVADKKGCLKKIEFQIQ